MLWIGLDYVCVWKELCYCLRHMNMILTVTKRTERPSVLRKADVIPAVVYGPKQEPISIAVDKVAMEKTIAAAGESTIVTLEGLTEPIEVLLHDVAFNPARGGVDHVDFYAIERGKDLTTNVTLEFVGEAPVMKTGATLTKVMHEVEVTCKPKDLPSHIDVDVSVLTEIDQQIHVEDLPAIAGVTINEDSDAVVVTVSEAREDEPETDAEDVDMDAVAVEEKGKAEEPA